MSSRLHDLHDVWERYVNNTFLYRIVSEEYLPRIRTHGLEPHRDPYESKKPDLEGLFRIMITLKRKGFVMMHWWGRPIDQSTAVRVTRKDLASPYIDFTPDYTQRIDYYLRLRGGALVNLVLVTTDELLAKRPPLTPEETKLVEKLNRWAKKRAAYRNVVLHVRASAQSFESAKLQHIEKRYVESPFGSYEHFTNVIGKRGLDYYRPVLERRIGFYVRVTEPIEANEIAKTSKRAPTHTNVNP